MGIFTVTQGECPFLKSIFTSNLPQTEEKGDYTKNVSIQFDTREEKIKAASHDWRGAYICPSNRTASQMRNRLGYRGTP